MSKSNPEATGDYVALEDLFVGFGIRAHYKGDTVPAESVVANNWRDKVQRPGTQAADAAQGAVSDTV